jgi:hypothetical protein
MVVEMEHDRIAWFSSLSARFLMQRGYSTEPAPSSVGTTLNEMQADGGANAVQQGA